VIKSLLECEDENKSCRFCKLRKNGCILFIRDSVAVALELLLADMILRKEKEEKDKSTYFS